MKVLVTGASGLVGSILVPALAAQGHAVMRLSRGAPGPDVVTWDPARSRINADALAGVDAVVHLAGANIAGGRWTEARKREIRESRVAGTRLLVDAIGALSPRPRVFIGVSATGFYGDTGETLVDEDAPGGGGFLAEVCQDWEFEIEHAETFGLRTVVLRLGVVLHPQGGALGRMLPVFRAGLGGPIGHGRQWMSWIGLDDLAAIVVRALVDEEMTGAFNVVAPEPVRNAGFATVLGRVLGRPAAMRAPAMALKLLFGQMAEETILASSRVRPGRLADAGYAWQHPDLEGALRHLLGR